MTRAATSLLILSLAVLATPARGDVVIPPRPADFVPPYAADEQIAAMGREEARLWKDPGARVQGIIDRIFWKRDGLDFTYRSHPTLTASQGFAERAGNCLSLVNLFVALARSARLRAVFVEVEDFESFYRYEGTVIHSTHVVGGVIIDGLLHTVDFMPDRPKIYRRLTMISDDRAVAHYFNDIGAEAMLGGDSAASERDYLEALSFDPELPDSWNNYAVLLRRTGNLGEAIGALEKALELDHRFLPAMENLTGYYRLAKRPGDAARMEARALDEETRNPYYLTQQAFEALQDGRLDEAESLVRRARRLDARIPEVHLVLGRIELKRGHPAKAQEHFDKAQKLSAEFSDAFQRAVDDKIHHLLAGNDASG
jgi:tetratricopeptide (TPR) repeat protein